MIRHLLAVAALLATSTPVAAAAPLPVVDVLVLYSPKALEGAGSVAALRQKSETNAQYTNGAFVNSKAKVRTRIVGVEPAPGYNPEGKDESTAAYDYMFGTPQAAADLRDRFRADVVAVTAAEVGGFSNAQPRPVPVTSQGSGKKMLIGYDRSAGFFAHELGHLLGLAHDKYVGGDGQGAPAYTHARGYVAPSLKWRTLMAYENKCVDAGTTCPDIQYFANPDLTYAGERLGQPKGHPEAADEVSMLNESGPIVAAYR